MVEVFALRIADGTLIKDFDKILGFVETARQERIRKFRRVQDAQRSLMGDLLVRYIISKQLNIDNDNICFERNDYGKPFLLNDQGFHFNVSHSNEWIACATSNNSVGVDVEQLRPIDMKIAERFFSLQEYEMLISKPEHLQLSYFYELWTFKESYVKACGKGLSMPLDSFVVKMEDSAITVKTENCCEDVFFLKQYDIDPMYKFAVCAQANRFPAKVIVKSVEEILDFLRLKEKNTSNYK